MQQLKKMARSVLIKFFEAVSKLVKGARWRLHWVYTRTVYLLYQECLYGVAYVYRRTLSQPVFVGVTGSTGKSTTKDLIASILEHHLLRGKKAQGSANGPMDVAYLILGTRPSDAYCIAEVATTGPGSVDLPLAISRPTVGVVTNIGSDHISAFGSIDAIADEKGKLIRSLLPSGVAILNADDPRVLGMQSKSSGRTITYGLSHDAMLRGKFAKAAWPDRLSLTVWWNGQTANVQTQLCGDHWVPVVLASLATGVALGVPLAVAAEAVSKVAPYEGRMSPVELGDGVTFIRDDWKAPLWTFAPTFEFMRQARAKRKIIVIGTISDYRGDSSRHYVQIARHALAVSDCVVFVGPRASSSLRARQSPKDALWAFATLSDASTYLAGYLEPGDLVLLKGSTRADHLERLIFARTIGVKCWRSDCGYMMFCNACDRLNVVNDRDGTEIAVENTLAETKPLPMGADLSAVRQSPMVVVGLGNPEARFVATPHNVGQRAVNTLAQRLGETWKREGELAMVVRTHLDGLPIYLIKLLAPMNDAGSTLRNFAQEFDIDLNIENCILIHDDLDIPIGTVRVRMRGGDGGHRGVQSIVQVYQDDKCRRIKIGVGRPPSGMSVLDYVLTPFPAAHLAAVELACDTATDRILALLKQESIARSLLARKDHGAGASINPTELAL